MAAASRGLFVLQRPEYAIDVDALLTEARQLDVGLAEVIKLVRERDALMEDGGKIRK